MSYKVADFLFKWRWIFSILTILFFFAAAQGRQYLGFSTDYRVFFSPDNEQLQAFESLQGTYGKDDNVLIVVAPKDRNIFDIESLEVVRSITDKAWKLPYVSRVDSITNFQHATAQDDDIVVIDLYEPSHSNPLPLEQVKDVALNEPLLVNRLISKEGHVSAVNIVVNMPGKSPFENSEVVAAVRTLKSEIGSAHPDHDVYLTGLVMYNNAFLESSMADNATLIPVMYSVLFLALLILLRSIVASLSITLIVHMSMQAGLGLPGWLGFNLSTLSAQAGIMILAIAGASSVHLVVTYLQNYENTGDKYLAMKMSLQENLAPIALTSITTIIGFSSLNFSVVPPIQDLGNIVSLGVIAAFIFTVGLLPTVCLLLSFNSFLTKNRTLHPLASTGKMIFQWRRHILIGFSAVALVSVVFIPKNELNDEFVKYFDEKLAFRQATDFTVENLTGLYSLHIALSHVESKSISDPEILSQVERFSTWLREQPEVIHVSTVSDTIKRINKNMHSDNNDFYQIPEDASLSSQYLLFYRNSLPYGMDMNNRISFDDKSTRVSASLHNLSTIGLLDIEDRVKTYLDNNSPDLKHGVSSTSLMFAHIGEKNVSSMVYGMLAALILISIVLMLILRSVVVAGFSLLTNLLPITMFYGAWAIFHGQIGMSLAIVGCITLGIVVDDTVHILFKYLKARRQDKLDVESAVVKTLNGVGVAVWTSSIVFITGFMTLSFSTFSMNADMGIAVSIVVAFALLIDIILLPAFLLTIGRQKVEENKEVPAKVMSSEFS